MSHVRRIRKRPLVRTPELSVIIPCFNDTEMLEERLPPFLRYLGSLGRSFEVILSDDGSDHQNEIEELAERLGCRAVFSSENRGKGSAVRRGMLQAEGELRIFIDADIPFDYTVVERILYHLDHGEFQVVIGDRTLEESEYIFPTPWYRQLASTIYSFAVRCFIAGGFFDTQCGVKGFRKDVALDLFGTGKINRFAFDVELLYVALKRNYDIKRLPVVLMNGNVSHVRVMRDGLTMLGALFKIYYHHLKGSYRNPIKVRDASPLRETKRRRA